MAMAANEDAHAGSSSKFLSIFVFSTVIFFGLIADTQITSKTALEKKRMFWIKSNGLWDDHWS